MFFKVGYMKLKIWIGNSPWLFTLGVASIIILSKSNERSNLGEYSTVLSTKASFIMLQIKGKDFSQLEMKSTRLIPFNKLFKHSEESTINWTLAGSLKEIFKTISIIVSEPFKSNLEAYL